MLQISMALECLFGVSSKTRFALPVFYSFIIELKFSIIYIRKVEYVATMLCNTFRLYPLRKRLIWMHARGNASERILGEVPIMWVIK